MKRRFLLPTLRSKIALFIIILLFITASLFSLVTIQTMNRRIMDEVVKRAESLGRSTAALAPYSILSEDLLGADNIVSKIKDANPDVEYAAVTDTNRKILVHTDVTKRGETFEPATGKMVRVNGDGTLVYEVKRRSSGFFEILTPVLFKEKQIGNVFIGVNKSVLLSAQSETRTRIIIGIAVTLILGAGCIIVLSSFVTRPIRELSTGVDELKKGRRARSLKVYSHDELGKLTRSFNEMSELITSQQAKLGKYARELEEAYISIVKVLAAAIDARDPYTLGHSTRVAALSLQLGEAIGLSPKELEDLEIACLFHDVGKIKTSDLVLLKDGSLDTTELREIASHCEDGENILSRAPSLHKYIPAVRHHHEWFNGRGYPDGLSGEKIPLQAAIISVADAFDAMTSIRPYRNPLSKEAALNELVRYSGQQFNPSLVEVFLRVMEMCPMPLEQSSEFRVSL
ncbi:MAG TPA: HD-GYP domain-containing protein [Nitrospirota bacterium]|nr:HD-GYP domain-containing protein [Nitrospirota bacterium]